MHESLAESLQLAGTVISMSHHGEIRVHTGIPAAVSLHTMSGVIIFDIVTLAGRTYEGTGTTCQTWFMLKFFPYRGVELFCQCISVPSFRDRSRNMAVFLRSHELRFFSVLFFCICAVSFCQGFLLLWSVPHPCQSGLSSTVRLYHPVATSAAGSAQSMPNTLQKQDSSGS